MSRSFALVKFKKTGNIYYGCYNGTPDILLPFLCTPKECYNEEFDCYCAISYCMELSCKTDSWRFPDDVADLDDVEIYSDYGGGFYWSGKGSESIKMVDYDSRNPWETSYDDIVDGMPEWAEKFLKELRGSDE